MLTGDVPFRTNKDICGGDISFTWVATFFHKKTKYKLQITNYKVLVGNLILSPKFCFPISLNTLSASFKSCDEFFLDVLCLDRNVCKSFEICMCLANIPMNRDIPFEAAHLMRACLCPNPNTRLTLSEVKRLC